MVFSPTCPSILSKSDVQVYSPLRLRGDVTQCNDGRRNLGRVVEEAAFFKNVDDYQSFASPLHSTRYHYEGYKSDGDPQAMVYQFDGYISGGIGFKRGHRASPSLALGVMISITEIALWGGWNFALLSTVFP
jgi:hypothetical protein